MSGPDNKTPGQFAPDNLPNRSSLELTPKDYYVGLSVWDAYRVSLFVHMVRRASEGSAWGYAVLAYGSTTRPADRERAHDIDLKVLTSAGARERAASISHIRDWIRGHYRRFNVPLQEYDQTFKWDSVHPSETFARLLNEDPSFVINGNTEIPVLPLHISIAGTFGLPASEKIELFRQIGDKSFAVLLEPTLPSAGQT